MSGNRLGYENSCFDQYLGYNNVVAYTVGSTYYDGGGNANQSESQMSYNNRSYWEVYGDGTPIFLTARLLAGPGAGESIPFQDEQLHSSPFLSSPKAIYQFRGVAEILDILASIISGFAIPLRNVLILVSVDCLGAQELFQAHHYPAA
jgi:hypothetical protein